ncbi:MAG TPA: methylenetetrahydrofolate reductase C-terminal domain-containing protein [Bacteroidales bacterium]|nr:methylenetetrahydrofolate reductase C-terminal domain-containing protein [Bacteroidales bacterium]
MSGIKPARRWQPAFFPFKKETFGRRVLAKTELCIKGPIFGCRMCGNCLLQETAFICPMECPKGLRNGPCGGITPLKRCYVDQTRKCVWYSIYDRALKTGREELLLEVLPPLDWDKVGTETWGDVIRQVRKVGAGNFFWSLFSKDKKKNVGIWDSVFKTIRQPDWWQGDSEYHPPKHTEPASGLEAKFRTGEFVITSEVMPPIGTNVSKLTESIEFIRPYVSAINFTESASARPRMSSIACSSVALKLNAEPVFQVASRDITRCGLQSAIVGINELGIRNVLCVSGDSPRTGPSPISNMNLVDLDSVQMLWILRRMRDENLYLDGKEMKDPPKLFLGAATSPFASDPVLQAIKDHKKINAGAQFLQTNIIFEPEKLDFWLEQLDKRGVLNKVYILVGVTPLKSLKMARHLNSEVPGVRIPEIIMKRMEKAGESAPEEGIRIALEMIDSIKNKPGVNGIHLMTLGWSSVIKRIVSESGFSFQAG